jgi:HEAT repeat protein
MYVFPSDRVPSLDAPDAAMAPVIEALRSDPLPSGRAAAAQAMSGSFDSASETALLAATHDADARVRGTAVMSLFGLPTPARLTRLRELAGSDTDADVRRVAEHVLRMMSSVGEPVGMATPGELSPAVGGGKPEATDEEAIATLEALGEARSPEKWATARRLLSNPRYGRRVRQFAMRALGIDVFMAHFTPQASAVELVSLLTPFLSDDDPSTRLAAAREFEHAKIPEAVAALEARKRVEQDARVLDQIDGSLREIARKDDFPPR